MPKNNKISAEDVAKAFNKHKHNLLAVKGEHCCDRGSYLHVANDMVLLRRMLLELGIKDSEIDKILYVT